MTGWHASSEGLEHHDANAPSPRRRSHDADPTSCCPAIWDAFKKLDPRAMVTNPVMFVVEIVATLTTVLFIRDLVNGTGNHLFCVPDQSLALVHRAVREFRRSHGGRSRQGAGRQRCARHKTDRAGQAARRARKRRSVARSPAANSCAAILCWSRRANSSPPTAM